MQGRKPENQLAMSRCLPACGDQPAIRGACEGRDDALDRGGIAYVDRDYFHAERGCHGLDDGELADPGGLVGSRKTAARVTPGAICLSSSSHFPAKLYSSCMNPVVLPPGRARLSTKLVPTGSTTIANTIGMVRVACCNAVADGVVVARITSGASATNSAASLRCRRHHRPAPADVDPYVATVGPAQLLQPLQKRCEADLALRIVRGRIHEHADAPHPLALLRARRERPCGRRAAEQRDELAPLHHSITPSARASSEAGTSRPSALAVLRLMIISTLVTCCTGRSVGFSPLRIRPV